MTTFPKPSRVLNRRGMLTRILQEFLSDFFVTEAARSCQMSSSPPSGMAKTLALSTSGPKLGPYPASSIPAMTFIFPLAFSERMLTEKHVRVKHKVLP